MALSAHDTLPQMTEVLVDEREINPQTRRSLGVVTQKAMELDEATRIMRLGWEDSPYFEHDGISGHGYPMIARDDMTGLRR